MKLFLWEKPNLWTNYSPVFDTTGYHAIYSRFKHNRTTEIDTFENVITHSYISHTSELRDTYEYYAQDKVNLFGVESFRGYRDYYDEGRTDIFYTGKKLGEIEVTSTNMVQILSGLEIKRKSKNKFHDGMKDHERDLHLLHGIKMDRRVVN